MIKHFTLFVFSVVFASSIWAQQDGYQTHFAFNRPSYNPAFTGSNKGFVCVTLLQHQQYVGFKSSEQDKAEWGARTAPQAYSIAPVTSFATIEGNVGKKFSLGMNVIKDKIGAQSFMNAKLNLAYTFGDAGAKFTAGLYAGIMQKSVDGSLLVPLVAGDPGVPTTMVTGTKPDFGIGLAYENFLLNNLYVGYSVTHLLPSNYLMGGSQYAFTTLRMHHYLVAGMEFPLSNGTTVLKPTILLKSGDFSNIQFDVSMLAEFNEKFWAGLSYRDGDNVNAMFGLVVLTTSKQSLRVGYSFDYQINKIRKYDLGSHELFIHYCFRIPVASPPDKYRLTPRYLGVQ